jgi:hypothetical protein
MLFRISRAETSRFAMTRQDLDRLEEALRNGTALRSGTGDRS